MKRIIALLLATVILLSFTACSDKKEEEIDAPVTEEVSTEAEEEYTPLLYKVSDENSCIWLFGSIHVGNEEMQELPDYVTDAFDESDALAVECNINAFSEDMDLQIKALSSMVYDDGTTIADHISPELYKSAKQVLTGAGMYNNTLDFYQPSMWSMSIDQLSAETPDFSLMYAIDTLMMNMAEDSDKEIKEIESVFAQYNMLSSFSPELQELMLESSVEAYKSGESEQVIAQMIDAWCSGDAEALISEDEDAVQELTEEEKLLYEEYNTAMVTDRNILMTDYAEEALKTDSQQFICVGTAHVVGEGAMAELLEERGYTVEIID